MQGIQFAGFKLTTLALLTLLQSACQMHEGNYATSCKKNMTKTLTDSLLVKKSDFLNTANEAKIKVYQSGIDELASGPIIHHAFNVGDTAPNFLLPDVNNRTVELSKLLKKGPVIISWYRGSWCPYCSISLHFYDKYITQFEAKGVQYIAITPERFDKIKETKSRLGIKVKVLHDKENQVAELYNIVYTVKPEVLDFYSQSFDLEEHNGNGSNKLPLAATYLIDKNGIIRYAFLDADYRNRAEPEVLLKQINLL